MIRTIALAVALASAATLQAQRATPSAVSSASPPSSVASVTAVSSQSSVALEMLAGAAGSLLGMAVVGLSADCGADDLACIISAVGAGGALGAVGATTAVVLTARATGAPRSVLGAALGAIVGTGVGLGVHWMLNRNSDRNLGDRIVLPIFALSQGVGATLGSRALGR